MQIADTKKKTGLETLSFKYFSQNKQQLTTYGKVI